MRTIASIGVAAVLAGAPVLGHAENGQIAAGILGGFAAGAIVGSAVRPAPPPAYYYPAPVYVPPPAYVAPAPLCYYTPGQPVWDGYRGVWMRPQVRVCE